MVRPKSRRFFHENTCCHIGAGRDLRPDEKRLQCEFDNKTLLRWNHRISKAQVWYDAPSGLYCVMSIEAPYSLSKVLWLLKRREQNKRQALQMYEDHLAARQKEDDEQVADVAAHATDAVLSWSKGKVTTSGKGL